MLSDELLFADADADADAEADEDEVAAVVDLLLCSAKVVASLRSSRSVAELVATLLLLVLLLLLAKGDVPLEVFGIDVPSEPARGREGPAESGCANEFW